MPLTIITIHSESQIFINWVVFDIDMSVIWLQLLNYHLKIVKMGMRILRKEMEYDDRIQKGMHLNKLKK